MDKIASAFVKAQRAFAPALKTSTNPHFKTKYVALSGCVEAVLDALNENGIALIQSTHECHDGVTVETLFLHESGETLSGGKLHVPALKQDAQGYGSALTYARRYSLMAACGIAPEDDDGNAASRKPTPSATPKAPVSDSSGASVSRDAFNALPPDTQEAVRRVAEAASRLVEAGNLKAALSLIVDQQSEHDGPDGVGRVEIAKAQWSQLNSKVRSAIKAEQKVTP